MPKLPAATLAKVYIEKKRKYNIIKQRGDNMEIEIICTEADGRKLSEHIKDTEFACKDGTREILYSPDLIDVLEAIRNHFDNPIIINSGYRTPAWNAKVGGVSNSYHCKGMAADIHVKGRTSKEVAEYANKIMTTGGIIRYTNFVHIDVRGYKYRKGV